jgi:hypothetical protein
MNPAKERNAIYTALDNYRTQLDSIPDGQFTETPAGGGWSYAEVYSHILQATLGSCIALERCANNNCQPTPHKLNFFGKLVMLIGRFPAKVKVPEKVAAKMPVAKISKEEAKNLIIKSRKRLDEIMPLMKEAIPGARHKHPRLGMLNANQWLKFIRIHLLHHLKQLDRISKKFSKA